MIYNIVSVTLCFIERARKRLAINKNENIIMTERTIYNKKTVLYEGFL